MRQYDAGEGFVRGVVRRVGIDGLNLVWRDEANLPSIDEIPAPERWVARVAAP